MSSRGPGAGEDTSGGFTHGGWIAGRSDPELDAIVREQMSGPFDLLLGRVTFDIWEPYWPAHADVWPEVMTATKYVASDSRSSSEWQPTVFLGGDVPAQVAELKAGDGPDLHVFGSADLLQTLFRHDLVDQLSLRIYPLTLGTGKRLFADGTIPARFDVTSTTVTPSGVVVANYERTPEG